MNFYDKLLHASERNASLLCVGLDPDPAGLPPRYQDDARPFIENVLAWNRAVVTETADLVCAYKPNIAFYEALGAPGMELLRQTLALIPSDVPVLLDAKRGDIDSTAAAYARACFEQLGVDAVTLSPYLGRDSIDPFAAYDEKGLFILCHTSNASAAEFQTLEISDWRMLDREPNWPLYLHVARTAVSWTPNAGLVVGATFPDALAAVRRVAPRTWILVPGVGAQGGDLEATLDAGLRDDGLGLIINVSRSIAGADDHRAAAQYVRDSINAVRQPATNRQFPVSSPDSPVSSLQSPVSSLQPSAIDPTHLAIRLTELGALQFGDFTLAGGTHSPFYIDLRLLVSRPTLLATVADAYAARLAEIDCERIAGVPYAALPIGTAVALAADVPMIYPRKEAKAHGLGKQVEGVWQAGDRVVIIEDLITSGGSIVQTAETLRALGLVVEHAIVLIDREQGGAENLAAAGIQAHSVFKLTELLDALVAAGQLDAAKRREILDFIRSDRNE